jgi:hypothetical protein
MNLNDSNEKLNQLVNDLIDDRLTVDGRDELVQLLSHSEENRVYYRKQVDFEAGMRWLLRDSEAAVADSPLEQETTPLRRRTIAAICGSIAACILAVVLFNDRPSSPSEGPLVGTEESSTSTSIRSSSSARWEITTPKEEIGTSLKAQVHTLTDGFVSLQIGKGVQVFIEAPCTFEPVHSMLFLIHKGRANVEVGEEGHGFTMRTPAGDFIDFGTRFGVAVGSDESGNDVVMSEVFTGEVKMNPRDRDSSASEMLIEGEARGLLGRKSYVEVSHIIDERPIKLDFNRYEETTAIDLYRTQDLYNLALGKKVTGNTSYMRTNGEIFPAKNLTDGRINDTGFPGSWSFWLASNENPVGEIIIDLGDQHVIDCLQLLNTQNRHHRDRGTKGFTFFTSSDSKTYQKAVSGKLAKLEEKLTADGPPKIETFIFPEHSARYLKLVIHTFYRAPAPSTSAGLNEIRIFGPSMPLEMREQILQAAKPNPDTTP